MLNQGYNDLTAGETNCILNDAQFVLNLNIGSTAYTSSFYSTTSLLDVPSDNLYVTTLTNLLNQVPDLGAIDINLNNNTIRINTDCERTLEGVEVKIDLKIVYHICCALQCGLSGGTAIVPPPCPNICSEWFWNSSPPTGPNPTLSYYNCDGLLTVINNPNTKGFICVSGGTTPYYTDMAGGTVVDTLSPCCYSQMFISGITATRAVLIIKPSIYPVNVNWGDGSPIATFNVGVSTNISHDYSQPFTGLITVYSKSLSTIEELSVFGVSNGSGQFVAIATTEIAKASSCKLFVSGYYGTLVIGDVADLPNSLLTCLGYSNGLTGDIANIPPSITTFEAIGATTLYGDIKDIPTSVIDFDIFGDSITVNVTGDVATIPSSIQRFSVFGNSTIYGDIKDIPTNVTYLTISSGNTVTGDISLLHPNMEYVVIGGSNTVSGDLSLIPANITYFNIEGNNTITTYSTSRVWAPNFNNLTIISTFSGFDSTEADQILTDLANVPWSNSGNLKFKGTSSPKYTNTTAYNNLDNGVFPVNNQVTISII
jgi:hypothetical protein